MFLKKKLIYVAGLSIALLTASIPVNVKAADSDLTGSGTTKVEFTAPTDGSLILNKVPSYDFASHVLASSYSGFTATGDNAYQVTDLRGGDTGYEITANASPLVNGESTLPVTTFTTTAADGTADDVTGGKISGANAVDIYGTSNIVATGNASSNGQFSSGTTSAEMSLSTASGVRAGTYAGTIDYTLVGSLS